MTYSIPTTVVRTDNVQSLWERYTLTNLAGDMVFDTSPGNQGRNGFWPNVVLRTLDVYKYSKVEGKKSGHNLWNCLIYPCGLATDNNKVLAVYLLIKKLFFVLHSTHRSSSLVKNPITFTFNIKIDCMFLRPTAWLAYKILPYNITTLPFDLAVPPPL